MSRRRASPSCPLSPLPRRPPSPGAGVDRAAAAVWTEKANALRKAERELKNLTSELNAVRESFAIAKRKSVRVSKWISFRVTYRVSICKSVRKSLRIP